MKSLAMFLASTVLAGLFACGQEAPTDFQGVRRQLNVSAEVNAEEEILGGVYSNGVVPSSSTMWVRLVPLGGGAALRDANGNPSSSDRMPIKVQGSRYPAKTTPDGQWGWYDPEAADGPCRSAAANKNEVHDISPMNGVPDGDEGGGIEKHCATAGPYRVELLSSQFGSVVASREVDKVRINGTISSGGGLKGIEDPSLSGGGTTNVADVFVHFDIGTASYNVSGSYTVDNATTPAVNDTVGAPNDVFRFDAQHTTNWPGTTRGELMVKYNWGDAFASRFSNTDQVIRVKTYSDPSTYPVSADVIHPRGTGITSQQRKVVISQPDNAAANGNTFPALMSAGGIVSVTLSMKNTGTKTWSGANGYQLLLARRNDIWMPLYRGLSSSVSPNGTTSFAFDLRHVEASVTGTQPAFYQMAKSGTFFGAENGRDILISGPKGGAQAAFAPVAALTLNAGMVAQWVSNAEDGGTSSLPIAPDALRSKGSIVLEYSYDHDAARAIDIVFRFTFDPQMVEALPVEPAEGAADLSIQAGLVSPSEYWVRLTGTVPAGQGLIAGLPFRLVSGARPSRNQSLGTFTIYYPGVD